MTPRGWFVIPGVQEGARTLAEQMLGLEPAFAEIKGKTVLDLGCAEGLIMQEALKAGAALVHGVECNAELMIQDGLTVTIANLSLGLPAGLRDQYDIVLLLAIVHKLRSPADRLREFAARATERVVIRLPLGSKGRLHSKHSQEKCDCNVVMRECGLSLEQTLPGPRGELVQHWRRT